MSTNTSRHTFALNFDNGFKDEFIAILSKLVSFNTVSSTLSNEDKSNYDLCLYVKDFFDALNFKSELIEVQKGKYNLLCRQSDAEGGLLLSGHSDTVDFESETWQSNPLTLVERNNKLFGRGAVDMKGFIAFAMLFAKKIATSKVTTTFKKNISVLITCDEETTMQGANFVEKNFAGKHHFDLVIIGEPTEQIPVIAHKGCMGMQVVVKGSPYHSSNPRNGVNAIKLAQSFMEKFNRLEEELYAIEENKFDVPYPTLNLGKIVGGSSVNVVCPSVTIGFDARPTPHCSAKTIYKKVSEIVTVLNTQYKDAFSLERIFPDIDYFDMDDKDLISLIERITKRKCKSVDYCTEASFLSSLGPCIVYGPGSIKNAHIHDEYIDLNDVDEYLQKLCEIYSNICA